MNKQSIERKIKQLSLQNPFEFDFHKEVVSWIFENFTVKTPICETESDVSTSITKLKNSINDFKRKSNQGFDYDELHELLKLNPTVNKREFFNEFQSTDLPMIYHPQEVFDAFYKCSNF